MNRAWTSHKLNCMREFSRKKTGPKVETTPRPTLYASCAVKMHMDMDICVKPFTRKFSKKMLQTKTRTTILCEPAQSKCTWPSVKKPFMRECSMLQTKTGTTVLCEFAQSTCRWTSHKNNFMREFTGKRSENHGKSNPSPNSYRKNPSVWTQKCFKLRRILSSNSFSVPWVPWVRRVPGSSYARLSRPASRPPVLTSPSSWPQLSLLRKAKASRKPHTFKLSRERERERERERGQGYLVGLRNSGKLGKRFISIH